MEKEMSTITRQQAEIEKYKRVIKILEKDVATAKSESVKEFAEKVNKIITEIYNKHIFDYNDLTDEEKDAIINFSDDVTYRLNNLVKEIPEDGESNE